MNTTEGFGVDPKLRTTRRVCRNTRDLMLAAKGLRSSMSEAERVLWQALCGGQVDGLRFRRQHSVGPFVLDFWRPRIKLALEVDGSIHDDEDQAVRGAERSAHLAAYGYRVLRVTNDGVLNNLPAVLDGIRATAQPHAPPA
jgi:very-short-patch-repair endonuclease